ncbi:AMP-binding protein [Pseudodesulfovibrio sp. S3]|uniref:AMP-binding protein n=1 Tax=unclassified Pseudodesulfovibrio TaxID=2661612 RepID=UPI000FEC0749|nr:AMP-binding protein [Pseudodesulfovibrio sp. S3]MCJ2165073.1 AMP-binding protein [Pseudodesulfovibrio sp. S3-i]RWU03487.1 long-chain fatty acid--CoA ligase [Pseudodesulfovibrio sp. S3]
MSDSIKTLKDLLAESVEKHADRVALGFVNGEPITYAELAGHVRDFQTVLKGLGIKPEDKVAIISENMPNWAIAYFSITTMGAVVVPILQEFHHSAVHHILRHSEAKMVIVSRRYAEKVEGENFPNLETVVIMDDFSLEDEEGKLTPYRDALESAKERMEQIGEAAMERMEQFGEAAMDKLPDSAREKVDKFSDTAREKVEKLSGSYKERVERFSDSAMKQVYKLSGSARKFIDRRTGKVFALTEDHVAAILYTSGTTGHSKGVVLTHRNLVQNCLSGVLTIPVFHTDRFLSVLPMAHTYECTVGLIVPMHCGSAVYYLQKPPTPKTLLPAMQKVRPTVMNVVPLIIEKIYKTRIKRKLTGSGVARGLMKIGLTRRKLSQVAGKKLVEAFGGELRCMCIGGAPLSAEVELFLTDAKVPYAIGYGMTEASPLLAGIEPGRQRLRAIGPPLPGVEIMIDSPDPETGEGEVLAKGPNIMREYYKAPSDTKDTFTEDGWLKTGDLGKIEDGYLYLKGRLKNVIIGPSGENIYPEEVESIINSNNYVQESLVYESEGKVLARIHLNYDVLDEEFGVSKKIESEVRKKVEKIMEDIRVEVNSKVSTFARLHRVVEQVEPFEKTPTQKIKRFIYLDR